MVKVTAANLPGAENLTMRSINLRRFIKDLIQKERLQWQIPDRIQTVRNFLSCISIILCRRAIQNLDNLIEGQDVIDAIATSCEKVRMINRLNRSLWKRFILKSNNGEK